MKILKIANRKWLKVWSIIIGIALNSGYLARLNRGENIIELARPLKKANDSQEG